MFRVDIQNRKIHESLAQRLGPTKAQNTAVSWLVSKNNVHITRFEDGTNEMKMNRSPCSFQEANTTNYGASDHKR